MFGISAKSNFNSSNANEKIKRGKKIDTLFWNEPLRNNRQPRKSSLKVGCHCSGASALAFGCSLTTGYGLFRNRYSRHTQNSRLLVLVLVACHRFVVTVSREQGEGAKMHTSDPTTLIAPVKGTALIHFLIETGTGTLVGKVGYHGLSSLGGSGKFNKGWIFEWIFLLFLLFLSLFVEKLFLFFFFFWNKSFCSSWKFDGSLESS